MERLKGKTVLIGRDPQQRGMLVAVAGLSQTAIIPATGLGSVSRCKPNEGIAHCKINIDMNGNMRLQNINTQNFTYVDGSEIQSKSINTYDRVALGKGQCPLNINQVLDAALQIVGIATTQPKQYPTAQPKVAQAQNNPQQSSQQNSQQSKQEYSIKHLQLIYNTYETEIEEIQKKQQKMGKQRSLPIMLGSASAVIAGIASSTLGINPLVISIPIGIVVFVIFFLNFKKKDTSIEDRKAAKKKFEENYRCPNPECHCYLPQTYLVLSQMKNCPYCQCKFTAK